MLPSLFRSHRETHQEGARGIRAPLGRRCGSDRLDDGFQCGPADASLSNGGAYTHEFAPTINDAVCARQAAASATTALGADHVAADGAPVMASEDFGVFATHVPACFAFLGNGVCDGATPLHSRGYDFNDAALAAGVAFYGQLVRDVLPPS